MSQVKDSTVFLDVFHNTTSSFVGDILTELQDDLQSKYNMTILEDLIEQLAVDTYTYIKDGKEVKGNDQLSNEALDDIRERSALKGVPPVIAVSRAAPIAAPSIGGVSIYTALYNVLKDTPVNDRVLALNEGVRALIDTLGLSTAEELAKVASYIVSATGTVKGKLGTLDTAIDMTKDEAKVRLSRTAVRSRKYVTTPLLLTKLIQYKFSLVGHCDLPVGVTDIKNAPHPATVPISFDVLKNGHAFFVNVGLDDQILGFSLSNGIIDVKGDIDAFFTTWNMHLQTEEMIYVEIASDDRTYYDMLLAMYDFTYDNKSKLWSAKRNDVALHSDFFSISDTEWRSISSYNALICQAMNDASEVPHHHNDQYNLFLRACDAVVNMDVDFKNAMDKLAMKSISHGSSLVGKAKIMYQTIMKGSLTLKDAIAQAMGCRQNRGKYRNIGAREAISKNLMDPLYPMYPSPLVVARKFLSIIVANPDLYAMDTDVYGAANMRFHDVLVKPHGLVLDAKGNVVAPGKRVFYDNVDAFVNNSVGSDVQYGDFYSMGADCGIGRGLIDDIQSAHGKEVKELIGDTLVTFPANCMSHKLRIVHRAKYDMGCVKLILNKMRAVDLEKEMNRGWLYCLSYYDRVVYDVPGKFQSGEFYIYFSGRQLDPNPKRLTNLFNQWSTFIVRKCAVMCFSHGVMDAATVQRDMAMRFRGSVFDMRVVKGCLSLSLQKGDERSLCVNCLDSHVKNIGVVNYASDRVWYTPYHQVGKIYTAPTPERVEAMTMDLSMVN